MVYLSRGINGYLLVSRTESREEAEYLRLTSLYDDRYRKFYHEEPQKEVLSEEDFQQIVPALYYEAHWLLRPEEKDPLSFARFLRDTGIRRYIRIEPVFRQSVSDSLPF